ncbi:MAG: DNA-binding transcriptional regulator [Prevotella sp.]|nr:DNA-binding transcriptional regulator [Prevotella sp.]
MIRLIMLTDFTEAFSHRLLYGILQYSKERQKQRWVVCRMPPSFKEKHGIKGVLEWAKNWNADAIVGKFEPNDDLSLFTNAGIVTLAQDHKEKFDSVPNVTSDYLATGRIAADFFINRDFHSFAFTGYYSTIWSDERYQGFKSRIKSVNPNYEFNSFFDYNADQPWQPDDGKLMHWLRSLPRHTAIFCCDDRQGSMVIEACNEADINVPSEIAVLGVDNDELRDELCEPTLSSVNLDIERGGYKLAKMIENIKVCHASHQKDIIIPNLSIVSRASTNTFATDDPYIQKAIDFIHSHLDHTISVENLLQHLPLSRRLLEIKFKQATGRTIHDYIISNRLNLFASTLLESSRPIKEIALDLSFENYGNLIRLFRQKKGCTPTEYRTRNKHMDK